MNLNWPFVKAKDNYWVLLLFIIISQSAGLLGTIFTFSAIPTWYAGLTKPFFSPPNFLFGPVWTILYTFIGISAYLIWRKYRFGKKSLPYWRVFTIQLILNSLWSIIFFGFKFTGLALIEIMVMWYYIAHTIRAGAKLDSWSAYLLYPYLAWVSFATLLNFAIWWLN